MKSAILILFVILFTGCSSPEMENFEKDISADWNNEVQLSKFDIKYIQLNFDPFLDNDNAMKGIEDFAFKDSIYTLDINDKNRLLDIISDSSNFSHGECGTFALNAGFLFLENDTIKGIIQMGCGYYQWTFEPDDTKFMDGSLSDTGFIKMTKMLDEINAKMKK